jgi:CheY-like chemotaxis protein
MTILYAEDDIDDFEFFCEMINRIDNTIRCINTQNGVETLDFLENATVLPDLLVMDLNMPLMDGKACLKAIRKNDRFKELPIAMYSTSHEPKDREHCLQLGANDYFKKPVHASMGEEQWSAIINRTKRSLHET